MAKRVRIRVPATTANMGPGFDCIGMALALYNITEVREGTDDGSPLAVFCGGEQVHAEPDHLIYRTMADFFAEHGKTLPPVTLLQEDAIPRTRGLGSSAACVAAGLIAANILMGKDFSAREREKLINISAKIEGHPDNTTPALAGGMVVGAMTAGGLEYISVPRANLEKLRFAVMVPDFELATSAARDVLPLQYSREDVIFNASRTALLTAALFSGEFDRLRESFRDRIHQPYREELIPGMREIFRHAEKHGAYSAFLSGAGPTLIAVVGAAEEEVFLPAMEKYLQKLPGGWTIQWLKPDFEAAPVFYELITCW